MTHGFHIFCAVALLLTALPACEDEEEYVELKLSSSAFKEGEVIPIKHSCDGDNVSPPLAVNGVPEEAKSLALLVEDPDVLLEPFTHWIIWDIPAKPAVFITEDYGHNAPDDVEEGENSAETNGYTGPCPPSGEEHRYVFKVYALDTKLDISQGDSRSKFDKALKGVVIGKGRLMGYYRR